MSERLKYGIIVAIAAAGNGLLSCIVKLALDNHVTLTNLLIGSSCFGFIFFVILQVATKQKFLLFAQFSKLFSVGLLFGLSAFMFTSAIENLPASIAVILQFQFIWIGVMFDAIYRKQWPSKAKWIIVLMILIGTVFAAGLFNQNEEPLFLSPTGIIFGLLCACFFACYLFTNDHILPEIDWKSRSFCVMSGALTFTLFVVLPINMVTSNTESIQNIDFFNPLFYSAIMAIFGYAIPISFFAIGIPKIGSAMSSILSSFELPAAIVGAMFLLNESVSVLQWVGVIIIVISLILPDSKSH